MGILDDAIKEHLELKRQHGAGEDELKQLEDEAFGAAERPGGEPDPLAEAPTEFMAQPDAEQPPEPQPAEEAPAPRPRPDVADLQEAPELDAPAEEQEPAMEHEAVPEPEAEPEPPAGPSTEERHAIAEQPTELFDVEEELGGSDEPAPSEEELVEEEMGEPRLAPVDPLSGLEETEDDAEEPDDAEQDIDDFFDEKRLSDELDQALEAPAEEPEDEPEEEEPPSPSHEEDVLEETPDFLEEAPEDDRLWFEQKPPKDFDFDD